MSRLSCRVFALAGIAAAGLTIAVLRVPRVSELPGVQTGVEFGVIVGSIPFGGLHNDPPEMPLLVIASLLNAMLWGGVAAGGLKVVTTIANPRGRAS